MDRFSLPGWLVIIVSLFSSLNLQAKTPSYFLTLENHVFTPTELTIPANKKVKLIITNNDVVAEEFDSFDLNREKVLFPSKATVIYIGPLAPGKYEYFGEFNPNSARGYIVVEVADVN